MSPLTLAFLGTLFQWLAIIIASCVGLLILLVVISAAWRTYRHQTSGHPLHWLRARRGKGRTVEDLAQRLDMTVEQLDALAPIYHLAHIPKRRGGSRQLHVPDPQTKALQRKLLRKVFAGLRAHPAACGFERGRSILDAALPHASRAVVIRMDIVNFFPSTSAQRLEQYFRRIGWDARAATMLVKLCCHNDGLPQGAPTSPRLSNLVNYSLDVLLDRYARRRGGQYTRYADDITVSFNHRRRKHPQAALQHIRRVLAVKGYRMHRRRKLSIRRQHQRQIVTGLVVNDRPRLPRERRRWLRAVRHRIRTGRHASLTPEQLQGWLAYEHMIEGVQR